MPATSRTVVDIIARLVQRAAQPAPLDDAQLVTLEVSLGAPLPDELRAFLSVWGDEAPGLIPLAQSIALATRATEAFPHDRAEAQAAMRPGEYVFLDTFDPPGTLLLREEEGLCIHLVISGEARGSVWLATPHGLAPAYAVIEDETVLHGFASWYFDWLASDEPTPTNESDAGDAAAADGSARAEDAEAPELPPGDPALLEALCAENGDAGELVELPPGRYVLTRPLVIERSLVLDGAGRVEFVAPPDGVAIEVRAGCLALRGVTIDGGVPGQPRADEVGLRLHGHARAHLERVTLRSLGVGLSVLDEACVLVRACSLMHNSTGISAQRTACIDLLETGVGGGELCVRLEDASQARIARCEFSWASDGVRMISRGGLSIEGCRFEQVGAMAIEVRAGQARIVGNLVSGAGGSGVYVSGGTAQIVGNAITATLACINLQRDALAFVERNLLGGAAAGVFVQLGEGCAAISRNVLRGENLDGVAVYGGRASILENHVTGGRQFGFRALSNSASFRRNEAYRMGRAGFDLTNDDDDDEDEQAKHGNLSFDCDWESGRKPEGALFGVRPRDEPGLPTRACAVTGVACAGPTRVLVIDRAAPTEPIALPILVTISGGVVVRAERRPEHKALCAWLGETTGSLVRVVKTLLSKGIKRDGRTIGAVLVDDAFYLAAAAQAALPDALTAPTPSFSLLELIEATFANPAEVRELLGGCLSEKDRALYARVCTLRDFVRGGGLASSGRVRGLLVGAAMDGRAEASWFEEGTAQQGSQKPAELSAPFPDLDGLEAARNAPLPPSLVPAPPADVQEDWIEVSTGSVGPCAWLAPLHGAPAMAWLAEAAAAFQRTGLWPIRHYELGWLDELEGEMGSDASVAAALASARAFLRRRWTDEWKRHTKDEDDDGTASDDEEKMTDPRVTLAPFGTELPEPQLPASLLSLEETVARSARWLAESSLRDYRFVLLVRCAQPSDAVSVLGWSGTANHYLEPRAFNAVLRAWQARFGAVPIAADGSTLHFVVTRPPSDLDGARQLAAEQFALCPDIVDQGAGTLEALAADLLNAQQWSLWWD